jgi:hypothetical protein
MKSMEEISQLLNRQAPSDPLVKLLNDTFGPLGWEYDGKALKVNVKVNEGHFLSVSRAASCLIGAAQMFGLEVTNAQSNEAKRTVDSPGSQEATPRTDSPAVAPSGAGVEQGGGEPKPAVSAGTPKPTRKVINDSISECSRIILAKKLRTQDQLVKMVEAFMVKRKEELNEGQALKLLEQLKEILQ